MEPICQAARVQVSSNLGNSKNFDRYPQVDLRSFNLKVSDLKVKPEVPEKVITSGSRVND